MTRTTRATARLSVVVLGAAFAIVACGDEGSAPTDDGIGITSIKPAANDPSFRSPFDATPDPEGKNVYFTALTAEGVPAVLATSAEGGAPRILHQGAPLSSPFSIAISEDGKTLYVADGSAENGAEGEEDGAVFTLSTEGGAPTVLGGTAGKNPRGIEVRGDSVYFTGKFEGKAAVYRTGLGGGEPEALLAGEPLREPSGIAITFAGKVYVVDAYADGASRAAVLAIEDGKATIVRDGFAVGHPAGLATVSDDSALLLSGLDVQKQTDIVARIPLGGGEPKTFTDVIGEFTESAGLHRAKRADVFAWADSRAGETGTVYVLRK